MEEIEEELLRDPTATLGLGGSDSIPKQQVQKAPEVQVQEQEEEEDSDFLDTIGDIALAPFRGLEGTLNGVYNLADMVMFDVLPDLDTRFLGRSKTTAGSLVEGIAQFASGFVPIFGAAGKIGALAKAGTVTRGVAAGAVTDFVAFKGQEDRLSNLIQQFPELQNPVTEFLAHDANESEVEGRLKNVLEGLILEGAIGGTVTLFMKSLRALKAGKKVRDVDGGGADEVNKATSDSLEGGKAFAEMPNFKKQPNTDYLTIKNAAEAARAANKDLRRAQRQGTPGEIEDARDALEEAEINLKESIDKSKSLESVDKDIASDFVTRVDDYVRQTQGEKEVSGTGLQEFDEPFPSDPLQTASVKDRVRAAEERELQEKLDLVEDSVDDLEEAIELVPYNTYEDLGRIDLAPRGADKLKNRLIKKFPLKGADLEDAAEVEKFIDVLGKRFFGDVHLSITNKIDSAGLYEWGSNIVKIRQDVVEGGGLKRTAIHELWHSLSRYLPEKDVTAFTKQFEAERRKYIESFGVTLDEGVDPSSLLKREIPKELKLFLEGKRSGFNERNYRFKNVDEYFAEEMTDEFLRRSSAGEFDRAALRTPKTVIQDIAVILKDIFASIKAKLGIDQRRKVFNDFLAERKLVKKRSQYFEGPMRPDGKPGDAAELPEFKSKIETDPEWQQWTDAVRRGEKPRLPRMEMTGDIDSVHTILTEKYKNNPELVKNLDEPPNFHDEDLNTIVRDFAQKSIKDQREIAINAEIFKDVLTDSTEKLMKIVDDFDKTESIQSEAALRNQLSEVVEIYDYYRQMGKETALTLAMRRSKNPISRKIGLETSEMQNSALVKEFLNNNSGGMSAKKAVKLIKDVYNPTNPDKTLKGMLNVAKKTQGNKLLDATIEYWTNSILSGPRTQAVNFLGNLMTQVLTSLEMTAGAAIQGNMPLAKAAFASVFDVILLKEAWSSAAKTLITGKEVLDIGSRSFESNMQSIGKAIDFSKEGNIDKNTINLLGSFINLPARGLLTGDELFKQLSFRRAARLKATMDAFNLGLKDSKEIADYVEGKIEKIVTTGGQVMSQESLIREGTAQADKLGLIGKPNTKKRADYIKKYVDDNFDEDAAALAQYSIEEARYYTFTKELEEKTIAKSLQNTTNNIPMLKFVLPFVRTPANILSFALERTPFAASVKIPGTDTVMSFPGLRSEALSLREGMKSNDPLLRAQTTGKLITSVTTLGLFMDMVTNNNNIFPVVTGAGPRDDRQRDMLEQTGWRPYSIKIGDTYYSYKRLDPIATLLGISADMNEMMKESDQYDEEGVEMLFMATATALARNVSNKSFLAGVQMWSEAMNDPDRFGKTLGRNYAGSFVPNVLSQMQDYDKQPLREARTWADAAMKKLPGGRDMLDPQRNLLGEEKIVDYGTMGFINPVATSEDKSDIVLEELASLKHGFRHPSSRILQGNLNLLDYVNEQGRTAHDRRLDLLQTVRVRGRTLRQTLSKLIKSSKYQKLAGFSAEVGLPSPRVQEITKVLRKFKDLANRKMYKEFPELVSQKNNITRALQLNKQGVNRQDVLELLQQTN